MKVRAAHDGKSTLGVKHGCIGILNGRFIERCSGVQQGGVTGEHLAAVEEMTLLREENAGMRASLQVRWERLIDRVVVRQLSWKAAA